MSPRAVKESGQFEPIFVGLYSFSSCENLIGEVYTRA
jgi:hypothetical protein